MQTIKKQADVLTVNQVARLLSEKPASLGRPARERRVWEMLARQEPFQAVVRQAEQRVSESIPEPPDDLYHLFLTTGNRTQWEEVENKRKHRFQVLALAECVDYRGRFIQPLSDIIGSLCGEKTWVMPAHDYELKNFRGEVIQIDLGSACLARDLAIVYDVLGHRLDKETRDLIQQNLRVRVIDPFLAMIEGRQEKDWWISCELNWNAVCLSGVVMAGLSVLESRTDRARFVLAGERYSKNYLNGLGADGCCLEGLGYWNYGFMHYALLAETLIRATGGTIDVLRRKEARYPAMFGMRTEIINGQYPAFADCDVGELPNQALMMYLNRRFGWGLNLSGPTQVKSTDFLHDIQLMYFSDDSADPFPASHLDKAGAARTWFDQSGVFIARPGTSTSCRLGVALKGGNNDEFHNHNDVGSFVVVAGKTSVLLDPGREEYTARTLTHRYESALANSFGHPVPVISGQLQRTGPEARGEVIETDFSHEVDTLKMDLRSAYDVAVLKKLTREFVYARSGQGMLTVTDEVEFEDPRTFASALIVLGEWSRLGPHEIVVTDGGERLLVTLDAGPHEVDIHAENIGEEPRTERHPLRIGYSLRQPIIQARISLSITPYSGVP